MTPSRPWPDIHEYSCMLPSFACAVCHNLQYRFTKAIVNSTKSLNAEKTRPIGESAIVLPLLRFKGSTPVTRAHGALPLRRIAGVVAFQHLIKLRAAISEHVPFSINACANDVV